jgi:hypothetical protein
MVVKDESRANRLKVSYPFRWFKYINSSTWLIFLLLLLDKVVCVPKSLCKF